MVAITLARKLCRRVHVYGFSDGTCPCACYHFFGQCRAGFTRATSSTRAHHSVPPTDSTTSCRRSLIWSACIHREISPGIAAQTARGARG